MSLTALPGPTRPDEDLDDADDDGSGARMSFLDHLEELRKRIVRSLLAVLAGFIIAFAFIDRIFAFIMRPLQQVLPDGGKLVYTEPAEAFMLYMKVAALVGLIIAIPVVLYQVWMFVAPGLYAKEKRLALPFVFFATTFFVGGALFSHYVVFPFAWNFFAQFTTDYMSFMPRIQPTFSMYVRLMLAMGAVFQLPTVVLFLARIGVVTPGFLIKNTKYAILIIFVLGAVITPSGDPVSLTVVAAPMIVLYGLSIGIAWVFRRRPAAEP
jgi:sec-independent protein translocase protein TatC